MVQDLGCFSNSEFDLTKLPDMFLFPLFLLFVGTSYRAIGRFRDDIIADKY